MNTRDWYFRQPLKENEFDAAFGDVETAMFRIVKDLKLYGIASGGEVTAVAPLVVNIAEFVGYDLQGRRLQASAFSGYDYTNDSDGNPNTPSSGHFRWVTFVARHGYNPSDARTDGVGDPVFFIRTEMISSTGDDNPAGAGLLQVLQGTEAATSGAAAKPSVGTNDIVIADILIDDTGAIISGGIDYSRVAHLNAFTFKRYDSLQSYDIGQHVIYQGEVYISRATVPPGIAPSNQTYWVLWRRQPFPTSYSNPTTTWMNAKRQPVSGIDHWGFPSGKIVTVHENWIDAAVTAKVNTGNGAFKGPWKFRVNNGGSFAGTGIVPNAILNPNTQPWGPCVQLNVFGASVDAACALELFTPIVNMQGASFVMEWAFSLDNGGGSGVLESNTGLAMGVSFGGVVSGNSTDPIRGGTADYDGLYLYARGSDPQWLILTDNGSDPGVGGGTSVNVAIDQPHFAKIVIVGASASDDGTARCLVFVDGALFSNETISMAGQLITPFFRFNASQGEVARLNIGAVTMHARTALNNEFGP